MEEEIPMNLKPSIGHFEINLNTVIILVGFLVGAVTWGVTWGKQVRDSEAIRSELQTEVKRIDDRSALRRSETDTLWRDHMAYHKDRAQEAAQRSGQVETRLDNLEAETRKIDNLEYRMTVAEQSQVTLVQAVKELQTLVNGQAADIKVMREILQRLDQNFPARRSP